MTAEPEAIALPLRSIMTIPIFHPSQSPKSPNLTEGNRRIIGVLKCINRVVQHGSRTKDSYQFGFADETKMRLVAELIGTIAVLFWRVKYIYEDFERTVHGVLNNVLTIRASLTSLERHTQLDQHLKSNKHYYAIPDSISHLDALKWQIEKFSNRGRKTATDLNKIWIKDEINFSLRIARPLAKYFNTNLELKIDQEKLKAPPVKADSELLVTVFRNLIENAIKYAHRDKDGVCELSIWWEDGNAVINVYVQDNGIGVDDEDKELIFTEGYRAEEAIRRVTSGASAGLGLFQCKTIMREMHGDITLHHHRNPTCFRLTLTKE
jgi:signal transduction histidine kinase